VNRRTFLVTVGGGLLAAPLAAGAQPAQAPKAAKIGFLLGGTLSSPGIFIEPFKQILREKGWTEGQNLTLVYRYAEGHYERLPVLAREILDSGVDVIVTEGTPPARAAKQVTTTVPIVMASAADPVGSGLVSNLARPGGNLTGVSWFFSEINTKRLDLLKEAAPHVARVAVVYNPLNPISEPAVVAIEAAAKARKIRIQRLAVRAPEDFDTVFLVMTRQRMDAVIVLEDPMTNSQSSRVVDVALKGRVPAVFGLSNFAATGGFMSYGPSRPDLWRQAALLTDKILRGAKPGELPIEQPTKFDFVINVKTAKALGLTIPPSFLQRADQVIE
jgi:putative tryptophan/tyrosine transport system substrate-binding protein